MPHTHGENSAFSCQLILVIEHLKISRMARVIGKSELKPFTITFLSFIFLSLLQVVSFINEFNDKIHAMEVEEEEIARQNAATTAPPTLQVSNAASRRVDRLLTFFLHHIHRQRNYGRNFVLVEVLAFVNVGLQILFHDYLLGGRFANLGWDLLKSEMVS